MTYCSSLRVGLLIAVIRTTYTQECTLYGTKKLDYESEIKTEYSKAFLSENPEDVDICLTSETGLFGCDVNGKYTNIRKECFCSYEQLGLYKKPNGLCQRQGDSSKFTTCRNCIDFSLKGPCVKGELPKSCGENQSARDIVCDCQPGYTGNFCDLEKVTLLCRLSNKIEATTPECNLTNLTPFCYINSHQDNNLVFYCTDKKITTGCAPQYKECRNMTKNGTKGYATPCSAQVTSDAQIPSSRWIPNTTTLLALLLLHTDLMKT